MNNVFEERVYLAWLAAAMLPPARLTLLLEACQDPIEVYRAVTGGSEAIHGILDETSAGRLQALSEQKTLASFARAMEQHRISAFTIRQRDIYPECLRRLSDAPGILFYQGDPACLCGRSVAMVGSRRASWQGLRATRRLAGELSNAGVQIISGLAYGIDAAAHEGCITGRSRTIAVMGCGLDRIYPEGNLQLKNRILETGGLFLSEFAPGERPLGWHFPVRNRLISGLGEAVILMEAKKRSGSMTTVDHALSQGKEVFVYPGDPDSAHFEGNHQLLRDGGRFFTKASDILEDMNWLDNPAELSQNTRGSFAPAGAENDAENAVLLALQNGTLDFDTLCTVTGLSAAELNSTITVLEISGRVDALPGKQYALHLG